MNQIRTVVELDMVGYSDIARRLEENLDVSVVAMLNNKIQGLIDVGLKAINKTREEVVKATNGDNAVIIFECASDAHRFAEAVHKHTQSDNEQKQREAKRWFRIGCATGELNQNFDNNIESIAGTVITNAYRLEAAAKPGQFLIDTATYNALTPELKEKYCDEEEVPGKREEKFCVRRWQVIPRDLFLRLMIQEDSQVRDAVDQYESYFQSVFKKNSMLGNYKSLHDYFQELEGLTRILDSLKRSINPSSRIDNRIMRELVKSKGKLERIINDILLTLNKEELKQEIKLGRQVDLWKKELDTFLIIIDQVISAKTSNELIIELQRGISNISYVIRIALSFSNTELFNASKKILEDVKAEIDCLKNIQSRLDNSKLFYQSELDCFKSSSIEEIERFSSDLTKSIKIHDICQEIDINLNFISEQLEVHHRSELELEGIYRSIEDKWNNYLINCFENLHKLRGTCQSEELLKDARELNINSRDREKPVAKFYELMEKAYGHFVLIDQELLNTIADISDKLNNQIENNLRDALQPQVDSSYDKYVVFLRKKLGW